MEDGMKQWMLPLPAGWDAEHDNAGTIYDYLIQQGIPCEGVGVKAGDILRIEVSNDADPTSTVAGYVSTAGTRAAALDQAIADAKPLLRAIMQKPAAQRTNPEKIALGIAAALWKETLR